MGNRSPTTSTLFPFTGYASRASKNTSSCSRAHTATALFPTRSSWHRIAGSTYLLDLGTRPFLGECCWTGVLYAKLRLGSCRRGRSPSCVLLLRFSHRQTGPGIRVGVDEEAGT